MPNSKPSPEAMALTVEEQRRLLGVLVVSRALAPSLHVRWLAALREQEGAITPSDLLAMYSRITGTQVNVCGTEGKPLSWPAVLELIAYGMTLTKRAMERNAAYAEIGQAVRWYEKLPVAMKMSVLLLLHPAESQLDAMLRAYRAAQGETKNG